MDQNKKNLCYTVGIWTLIIVGVGGDASGSGSVYQLRYGTYLVYSVANPDPGGSGFKSPGWIRIRNPDPASEIELLKSTFPANFYDFNLFKKIIPTGRVPYKTSLFN